jgi:UDP-N-acetyl-D-galactosamine dehydrogenase
MGFTFKENVSDVRNTKVADIVRELESYRVKVDLVDPYANTEEVQHEYQIELKPHVEGPYDAIIVAVAHHQYRILKEIDFIELSNENSILIDVKGLYRNGINKMEYWSL